MPNKHKYTHVAYMAAVAMIDNNNYIIILIPICMLDIMSNGHIYNNNKNNVICKIHPRKSPIKHVYIRVWGLKCAHMLI